jgi:hypothetical protein
LRSSRRFAAPALALCTPSQRIRHYAQAVPPARAQLRSSRPRRAAPSQPRRRAQARSRRATRMAASGRHCRSRPAAPRSICPTRTPYGYRCQAPACGPAPAQPAGGQ